MHLPNIIVRPPLAKLWTRLCEIRNQFRQPRISNRALGAGTEEGHGMSRLCLPINDLCTLPLICKEKPEQIALSLRHRTEISIDLSGSLIPGDDIPTRTDHIGRIDPHRVKDKLQCRSDRFRCRYRLGGQLFSCQQKEMNALISI